MTLQTNYKMNRKNIKVRVRKEKLYTINYNGCEIFANNGVFSFDELYFDYDFKRDKQYIKLLWSGSVITTLIVDNNTIFKIIHKNDCLFVKTNRDLEYYISEYNKIIERG